jgi:hypothetical protein
MQSERELQRVIENFDRLETALIDSSSIIYMDKAGFLSALLRQLTLITIAEVNKETGIDGYPIRIISHDFEDMPTDNKIVRCAERNHLPVISEDHKLLRSCDVLAIEYYNALMMLNLLLYKKRVDLPAFENFLEGLLHIAHYSDRVRQYGSDLTTFVVKML